MYYMRMTTNKMEPKLRAMAAVEEEDLKLLQAGKTSQPFTLISYLYEVCNVSFRPRQPPRLTLLDLACL